MSLPIVTLLTTYCQQGKLPENEIQDYRSIVFEVADGLEPLCKKQRASQK
jgi:hypothetical protein